MKEETKKNIEKLAKELTQYPEIIEEFLYEAYENQLLGFDDKGESYNRNSGDSIIPHRLIFEE